MHALPPTYYIIFTAVTAVAVLLQALVLLAIFIALRKSLSEFQKIANEKVLPAVASARSLLEDVGPKLKVATTNLAEVSHTLRHQADHLSQTVESLLNKTDAQVSRVNELVTAVFNAVDQASRALENAVSAPARRVTGVINGVRAGVEVLVGRRRPAPTNAPTNGNETADFSEQTTVVVEEKRAAGIP
jgi:ABC-type transporter Mla subunit MlaD